MKGELLARLALCGQEHLLAFWDRLDDARHTALAAQIEAIDFALIQRLFRKRDEEADFLALAERAVAPPALRLDGADNRFSPEAARQCGAEAIATGQIGAILVAGGQGTRLGFDAPKGMFPIGPVSGRTLFQIHVERLLAVSRRYGVSIPLYLMTSPATHDETVEFFRRHDRFGLDERDLCIFRQGTMPVIDAATGKVLLDAPGRIATSPDGHGGMLAALAGSGALADIRRRGIRQLFYFQVDNPLIDICSPEFIGYHVLCESELSTQVVGKREPLERVGNVVEVDGRLMVIEYSDLPDDLARRRNRDGSLAIWAGSIAVHVMDVAFLDRMAGAADALPFHTARKRVPYVDPSGKRIEPDKPNAIKFERFIFDLLPSAGNAVVIEIDPAEGFAPLKNAPGAKTDTAEWVRARMVARHRRWLHAAGAEVADGMDVEINPLFALDADETAKKIEPGTRVTESTYFC